jgi:type II secretory pathway pseudopilin PulG
MKTIPRATRGFTIVEVMLAVMMFGMIIIGIYSVWSVIIQGSQAGRNAAAVAQRARVSIQAIQDALTTAQMFSANGKYYYFVADTSDEKCGGISFVARLPDGFPGVSYANSEITKRVQRVSFTTDPDRNLIMKHAPFMEAEVEENKPYELQLAKDVTLFMFEFWDDQKKEYVSEWGSSNQIPKIVRVALGLGKTPNSQMPMDVVTRTIAMPCMAIPGLWQNAPIAPGPPGMPGMPPGGIPPGGMPPGMVPPGRGR